MIKNFLEIKNVDFTIGGKTKVKNASFNIENEGETYVFLVHQVLGKQLYLEQ